jgi:hypothetical protein
MLYVPVSVDGEKFKNEREGYWLRNASHAKKKRTVLGQQMECRKSKRDDGEDNKQIDTSPQDVYR